MNPNNVKIRVEYADGRGGFEFLIECEVASIADELATEMRIEALKAIKRAEGQIIEEKYPYMHEWDDASKTKKHHMKGKVMRD